MTAPRSIDAGIKWHLDHDANGSGMCAQHTWHSLGGDYGNPPAWGCSDANEVYDKVKAAGRYWTDPHPGDIALWKYGSNGHAARVYHTVDKIATTNPSTGSASSTGIEPIDYPKKWGATNSARIFTDTYNLVKCFDSSGDSSSSSEEDDDVKHKFLYLSTEKDFSSGAGVSFEKESTDEGGFHASGQAAIISPWNSVGTYMVETEGGGVVTFRKYDADDERLGEIGRSVNGDLTIVQDLPKGYSLRVVVVEGKITSARLKADIRER